MNSPTVSARVNSRTVLLVVVVALAGGLAYQAVAVRLPPSKPRGTFEVREVEWKRTEWPPNGPQGTHVSYDGKGRVVGTGELAGGRYIVFIEVIRSKRVNPRARQDTTITWVSSFDGGSGVTGQDWAFACTELERQ